MDSRTSILNSIKDALSDVDKSKLTEPQAPEIWPIKGLNQSELVQLFSDNLAAVAGKAYPCKNEDDAVAQIGDVLKEIGVSLTSKKPFELGVYPSELAKAIGARVVGSVSDWLAVESPDDPKADPKVYEPMSASLVSPLLLLADTGSCVVEGRSAFERFLLYLSPVCLVVARASQLREHLPHAWNEIEAKAKGPDPRGEFAIVTGPSRTADIEKKLVLGVHGPQRLNVFIIQDL